MRILIFISLIAFLLGSCKKPEDRTCWKGHGDESSIEFPLDSIHTFNLGKRVKYRIYEDNERKIVIKGGEHMIKQVQLDYENFELSVNNMNKCHFLRDNDRKVEVEIHYPEYRIMNFMASDSVIFEDTIHSNDLYVKLEEGGGSMILNVDNYKTEVVVSIGTADYKLGGHSTYGIVKVQNMGYADATNFTADHMFGYQNSMSDLYLNIDGAQVEIRIDGTGDVYYSGTPDTLEHTGVGSGQLIAL